MTYTTTRRVARKGRQCETGYRCQRILPGDVYLEHKEFPGSDAGFADAAGHPVRLAECANCASRSGREHQLDLIPTEQAYRLGLV